MSFEVIAYAASKAGRANVERHPSQPTIHVATMCPTIDTAFTAKSRSEIRSLCERYAPVKKKDSPPLGFGSVGALIAFAHGVPNNAPQILYKKSKSWLPLFPLRVTSSTRAHFGVDDEKTETLREKLVTMRQTKLANADWIKTAKPHARTTLIVLAALSLRPRNAEAVSARTHLTVMEVEQALRNALANKWIDGRNRLTEEGHGQLAHARKVASDPGALSSEPEDFYYPTSLRAPSGVSS